jgi:large subunit ribosomal protein L30e
VEIGKELMRAVVSGEVVIGTERSLKAIRRGDAKLVIVAANCPRDVLSDTTYYARLGRIPLHVFEKNSRELGLACGKPFTVNVVTILNPGESDILAAAGKR